MDALASLKFTILVNLLRDDLLPYSFIWTSSVTWLSWGLYV